MDLVNITIRGIRKCMEMNQKLEAGEELEDLNCPALVYFRREKSQCILLVDRDEGWARQANPTAFSLLDANRICFRFPGAKVRRNRR